jgi:hypothetical protein
MHASARRLCPKKNDLTCSGGVEWGGVGVGDLAGTGHAERMADGHRAEVDVDRGGIDLEHIHVVERHDREGLVDFPAHHQQHACHFKMAF